ncbi:MAG: hypothetical protein H7Z42_08060 [Roseiflexaceae bacterium]|nr:hypothetical protein [Roseiflexaceae bacterium]
MRTRIVWALIILQFLLGLGAALGGGLLVLAPDGHFLQMPLDMLRTTPFATFLLPGILLFTMVGLYPLAVAYSLFARPAWSWPDRINPFKTIEWAWAASLAAGVVVIVWICVQMILLGAVAFAHVLYLGWGIAIIVLTLAPTVRQSYIRTT